MPSITLTSCCNPGIFAASVPHHAVSLYTSVEYFYCFQFRLSYCLPSCSTRKDRRLLVLLFPFIERDIIPVIHLWPTSRFHHGKDNQSKHFRSNSHNNKQKRRSSFSRRSWSFHTTHNLVSSVHLLIALNFPRGRRAWLRWE